MPESTIESSIVGFSVPCRFTIPSRRSLKVVSLEWIASEPLSVASTFESVVSWCLSIACIFITVPSHTFFSPLGLTMTTQHPFLNPESVKSSPESRLPLLEPFEGWATMLHHWLLRRIVLWMVAMNRRLLANGTQIPPLELMLSLSGLLNHPMVIGTPLARMNIPLEAILSGGPSSRRVSAGMSIVSVVLLVQFPPSSIPAIYNPVSFIFIQITSENSPIRSIANAYPSSRPCILAR